MHTTSSVKNDKGNIIAWAWASATETGSLVFIDDVTSAGSDWAEFWDALVSILRFQHTAKLRWRCFVVQMDNDLKWTANQSKIFSRHKTRGPVVTSFQPSRTWSYWRRNQRRKDVQTKMITTVSVSCELSPILDWTQLYFKIFLWIWLCQWWKQMPCSGSR